jgi:hypothetical protein
MVASSFTVFACLSLGPSPDPAPVDSGRTGGPYAARSSAGNVVRRTPSVRGRMSKASQHIPGKRGPCWATGQVHRRAQARASQRPTGSVPRLDHVSPQGWMGSIQHEVCSTRSKRRTRLMPAWIFGGTRQRTKRLEKSASEGDTRIVGNSGGCLQTIETGSDFPIGISRCRARYNHVLVSCLVPCSSRSRLKKSRWPD